ncbi:hypothetical protein BKA82DRAFT_4365629 [Pisolithus tinctorius]|nr:hypothetical protein BKA82DRAFT_4365629 [Pisolithus tinctorius]
MQRLCDEVIALIIYELEDPTALTLTSKRFLMSLETRMSVPTIFYLAMAIWMRCLGVGGAHISRYLLQVAIHHFYRGNAPFIKSQWVRSVRPSVFSYFQKVAAEMFDNEVPVGKHEDDGSNSMPF